MEGKWLKDRARAAGVTREQVGDALGVGPSLVTKIYSGAVALDYAKLPKLARLLKVSLPEMIAGASLDDDPETRLALLEAAIRLAAEEVFGAAGDSAFEDIRRLRDAIK